ncbi:MAG TPA: hypothetical protein VI122_06170 [Thermoleophilaceae bacterium]
MLTGVPIALPESDGFQGFRFIGEHPPANEPPRLQREHEREQAFHIDTTEPSPSALTHGGEHVVPDVARAQALDAKIVPRFLPCIDGLDEASTTMERLGIRHLGGLGHHEVGIGQLRDPPHVASVVGVESRLHRLEVLSRHRYRLPPPGVTRHRLCMT